MWFQYPNFQIGSGIWTYGLMTLRFRIYIYKYIYIYISHVGFRLYGVGFEAAAYKVFRVKPLKRRCEEYFNDGLKNEQ